MQKVIEDAAIRALGKEYQVKPEVYTDTYFKKEWPRRWLRVDGPKCEDWSCQLIAPFSQNDGFQLFKSKITAFKNYWAYQSGDSQAIAFVKITRENHVNDSKKGEKYWLVEGVEIPGFDYLDFYQKVSKEMPEWMILNTRQDKHYRALQQGKCIVDKTS